MSSAAGPEIDRLIQLLARLPGLGPRSARPPALQAALDKIQICSVCGNIDTRNPCALCADPRREDSVIVVVADVADLWALERAQAIHARYHVLGGTLSPLDGVGPQELAIDALIARAHAPNVSEV